MDNIIVYTGKGTIILHVTKAEDVSKLTWALGLVYEGIVLKICGIREKGTGFRNSCMREREGLNLMGCTKLQKQRLNRNRAL